MTTPDYAVSEISGLVTIPSARGFAATVQEIEALLTAKNIRLFAKIDHAAGAHQVGLTLRPTIVLLFGNPQAGTPLMQSRQTIGIDLPLKILVWEDESGKTQVSYNQPAYLARRHGILDHDPAVGALATNLEALARAAAS
jgi:uncharacterized protein (DUF302 family)